MLHMYGKQVEANTMIAKVLSLMFLAAAGVAMAGEPLIGAYGFKFGETPAPEIVNGIKLNRRGGYTYTVDSDAPDKNFVQYELTTTAVLRKIHTISATGIFPSKAEAEKVSSSLLGQLEQKYGPRSKSSALGSSPVIIVPEGLIAFQMADLPGSEVMLSVTYSNVKMETEGASEVDDRVFKPVEGAFGFKFGEVFDIGNALEKRPASNGGLLCVVKPLTPNDLFKEYFLIVTPKTHTIVGIWASNVYDNKRAAMQSQAKLRAFLESKYGNANEKVAKKDEFVILHAGTREYVSVGVVERQSKDAVMLIKYQSMAVEDMIKREIQQPDESKGDKSGL